MRDDIYISVDVEADGPIPGEFSMSSLGACVVGRPERSFYRELRSITERFDPEAARVSGLDRDRLIKEGADPAAAMRDFAAWIASVTDSGRAGKPVFTAFNATFDWMFVHWYFMRFTGSDPFGISGLDVKAYYMGAMGKRRWSDTAKRNIEPRFMPARPHTHNALDDAREQAELFDNIRRYVEGR
jgi:hypothetical protein